MQTQATSTESSGFGRVAISLFLLLSACYLLVARGRITSIDEWHIYGTTESLAESGTWRMNIGVDRKYSRYSVLPSLLGMPFYLAARPIAADLPAGNAPVAVGQFWRRNVLQAAVSLQTPFVTAATAMVLFLGLGRAGIRRGPALAATLVYALATLALPYSGSLYVQPLAALALVALVMSVAAAADVRTCLSLALLLAVRLEFLVLLPAVALHVWRFRRPAGLAAAWIAAGVAIGVGFNVFVNYCRGDDLFMGDYGGEAFTTPIWIGLHGLFFSSGKGLVWFAPAAAAGFVLMPWLVRTAPRVGLLAAGVSLTFVVMVASWWTWHGGWSWGPRLLVPLMPVLALPFAWLFNSWDRWPRGCRVLLLFLIIVSFAAQVRGVVTDPTGDRTTVGPLIAGNENESIYIPHVGPWGAETDSGLDLLLCRLWQGESARPGSILLVAACLAAVACSWFALRLLGVSAANLRSILPGAQPIELFALGTALVLTVLPSLLTKLLLAGEREATSSLGSQTPAQFSRLPGHSSPDTGKLVSALRGRLYAPLKGDYTFYELGQSRMSVVLGGRKLLPARLPTDPVTVSLDVGFHQLEIRNSGFATEFSRLYWTTPGNAHYKEPVPRLYLTGPTVTWQARWAIAVTHWKWLAFVGVGVVLLLARSWPDPAAVAGGEALAGGESRRVES